MDKKISSNNSLADFKNLKEALSKMKQFLGKMGHPLDPSLYRLTMTGDIQYEPALAVSVFATKIRYMLGIINEADKKALGSHILSFQTSDGSFSDAWVEEKSLFMRRYLALRTLDFSNWNNKKSIRAETRQSFAALRCMNIIPPVQYLSFPHTQKSISKYINSLNWSSPWSAGSHFGHLLFFLEMYKEQNLSEIDQVSCMIDKAISEVNNKYLLSDGTWGDNKDIEVHERINGSMKMMIALDSVDCITNIPNPKGLIDLCLSVVDGRHACDYFNIICVLYYCCRLVDYRNEECQSYALKTLSSYEEYYWPNLGGFSFFINKSQTDYYDAKVSEGLPEPDIHGTVMFLWGIVLISDILGWRNKLGIQLPVT